MNDPVIGQVGKKVENICHGDSADKVQIDASNRDRLQIRIVGHFIFDQHHKAQKHAQVQIVFRNCPGRLTLDGFVIRQKLAQDDRTVSKTLHR